MAAATQGRRQAGGINERARAVADQVDHRPPKRRDSRHRRRSLWTACPSAAARRTMRVAGEARAPPAADHAEPVGVVRHQPGVVLAAQARSRSASGARSPSMENTPSVTISAWSMFGTVRGQELPRMGDVVVAEGHALCRAKVARRRTEQACDNSSTQHQPVAADQHRDDPGIGEITGAEHAPPPRSA